MKIKLLAVLATAAGGLGAGLGYAGQAAQLNVTPAAGVVSSAQPAGTAGSAPSASTASATLCDSGSWRADDVSVEGAPDRLDAGDRGATYLWHDAAGWHLRTTDQTNSAHVYSGRIVLSTGQFLDVEGVRLESDDHFRVYDGVLYYRFVTYKGIDGLDFRVGDCAPGERQALTFHLRYDGALVTNRVIVGDRGRHPESDPFTAVRSL